VVHLISTMLNLIHVVLTDFICTEEWKKQFCAAHLDTAVRWLDSGAICDAFPIVGKTKDIGDFCNQLIQLVWDQPKPN
jgi:hypothetical protein